MIANPKTDQTSAGQGRIYELADGVDYCTNDECAEFAIRDGLCHICQQHQQDLSAADSHKVKDGPACTIRKWKDPRQFYDEMHSECDIREAYSNLLQTTENVSTARTEAFEKQSLKDFRGDNKLYHLPRMLTSKESSEVYNGVTQRARAIQAFLTDHYSGVSPKEYKKHKIIPKSVMKALLKRNGEKMLVGPGMLNWGFWYGPDLIRGPDGTMHVCEDNLGYIGGMGDLQVARKSLLRAFPEYSKHIQHQNPKDFYTHLSKDYHDALPESDQKVVLLHYPKSMWPDKEEARVLRIFKRLGMIPIEMPLPGSKTHGKYSLIAKPDGLYVSKTRKSKGKTLKSSEKVQQHRVGLVVIDAEICDIDPRHPTVKKKTILEEGKYWADFHSEQIQKIRRKLSQKKGPCNTLRTKLAKCEATRAALQDRVLAYQQSKSSIDFHALRSHLKCTHKRDFSNLLNQGVPGLLELYFQGSVRVINGPGFDFLGDKQFCMYVDRLIEFYLNEKPLLASIPTLSFAEEDMTEMLSAVFDDPDTQNSVVIKRVDGRGGDSVWVGPMISHTEFQQVREQILMEPEAFLVQKYIALSRIDGQLTDLRNLSSVRKDSIVVSRTLWSRGVPASGGNGKVNISDKGFEMAVCTAKS